MATALKYFIPVWHLSAIAMFFLLLLSPYVSEAQMRDIPSSLQWGSIQKAPGSSLLAKIIYANKQGVLALRYKRSGMFSSEKFWLEQYDASFNLRAKHELALTENHQLDVEDIFYWHGKLYLITTQTQADINSVWLRPISQTGRLIGTERLIAEISGKDKFRKRQFDLKFSKDSSFILLYNQLPPEKNGPERFTLRVFDQAFNLHWSKDISLPVRDRDFSIREYRIDDSANVFVLGRRQQTINGRQQPGTYSIYAYTNKGKLETAYDFVLDNTIFHRLSFRVADENYLVVGGIYALRNSKSFGLFHTKIDIQQQQIAPLQLSPLLEQETKKNRQGDGPNSYRLRDLVLRSDGGVVIIAEQYARSAQQIMTYYGLQSETYFTYNDILVANMTRDADFSWLKRIPKIQISTNDGGAFSSFTQATVQDRFYFIYNDNPENFSPDNRQRKNVDQHASVVSLTEIRRDGTVNTVPLFVNKDANIITRPKLCRQIGARSILVYGEDGRNYRFGLLRLE